MLALRETIAVSVRGADQLISYGSLPVSVVEWLMFDDETSIEAALK